MLGLPRAVVSRVIPVAPPTVLTCDAYGRELSACQLPVESFLGCHNALVSMPCSIATNGQ